MNKLKAGGAAVVVVVLLMCGGIVGLPLLFGARQALAACQPGGAPPIIDVPNPAGQLPAFETWNSEQVTNAAIIVATGAQNKVPTRGWVIAVATAIQESTLLNLDYGDRDSIGLFQQRGPWGPRADRMNPAIAARMFYTGGQGGQRGLLDIPGWQTMRLTDAADAVQRSGLPDAYQQWEDAASKLVAHVAGVPNLDDLGGGPPGAPCGVDNLPPVVVGPGGWVKPVNAAIGSGFRTPDRPGHDGVDLLAPRNTPIHAASTGTVITVICQSSIGSCDVDGGVQVKGCGWYVEIRNPSNVVSRYCHMGRRPSVIEGQTVAAGQVIGFVGSSGNSSGPHLHYEIHYPVPPGGRADEANAHDPVPFHIQAQAPLGRSS